MAGGTHGRRLEHWQGRFHILHESRRGHASIRCNVNPDQCLLLFIKSLELTAEKMKRAGHYPLHVTHSLADGLVFISLPCLQASIPPYPNLLFFFFLILHHLFSWETPQRWLRSFPMPPSAADAEALKGSSSP